VVRSDSKIDEDWQRKLRERERREYGEREKKKKKKRIVVEGVGSVFFF